MSRLCLEIMTGNEDVQVEIVGGKRSRSEGADVYQGDMTIDLVFGQQTAHELVHEVLRYIREHGCEPAPDRRPSAWTVALDSTNDEEETP